MSFEDIAGNGDLTAEEKGRAIGEEIREQEATLKQIYDAEGISVKRDKANRIFGLLQGMDINRKWVTVTSLKILKEVKKTKIYKLMPDVGTWEKFCKSVGWSREIIDENLRNLNSFGEEFLLTVSSFGIGYRDLRALKKAQKDGSAVVREGEVEIDGTIIPLDDEHRDDLQEALDSLQDRVKIEIKKAKQEIEDKDRLREAETKELRKDAQKMKATLEKIGVDVDGVADDDITMLNDAVMLLQTIRNKARAVTRFENDDVRITFCGLCEELEKSGSELRMWYGDKLGEY